MTNATGYIGGAICCTDIRRLKDTEHPVGRNVGRFASYNLLAASTVQRWIDEGKTALMLRYTCYRVFTNSGNDNYLMLGTSLANSSAQAKWLMETDCRRTAYVGSVPYSSIWTCTVVDFQVRSSNVLSWTVPLYPASSFDDQQTQSCERIPNRTIKSDESLTRAPMRTELQPYDEGDKVGVFNSGWGGNDVIGVYSDILAVGGGTEYAAPIPLHIAVVESG